MLTVTENARQYLKEILAANIDDPGVSLRLDASVAGKPRIMVEEGREGDEAVEHEGYKVLLVPSDLSCVLDGVTMDCEETTDGPCLVMFRK